MLIKKMVANKELSDGDYVNLKAAKALKSIGYNFPSYTHYLIHNGKVSVSMSSNAESWLDYENVIDRPILQKAVEWLRKNHKVSLRISYAEATEDWFYDYLDLSDGNYTDGDDYYCEYNDAVNAGICEICAYIKEYKLN